MAFDRKTGEETSNFEEAITRRQRAPGPFSYVNVSSRIPVWVQVWYFRICLMIGRLP